MPAKLVGALLCAAVSILAGCLPVLPEPRDAAAVDGMLSRLVLQPYVTCEQLKTGLGLEHLEPIPDPAAAGLPYEEYWLPTADYELIRTWYLPTNLDRGVIVLSMGAAGDISCYLFVANLLTDNGWSVVLYDNRGFGLSTGSPSLSALDPDLELVVDWACARSARSKVTVLGISLGSIPAVAVAARRPDAVNALVLDSPVALGKEIERFSGVLGGLTTSLLELIDPRLLPEKMIAQVNLPLLIYLHENDIITPPATVETIYERAAGYKVMVRFDGLPHVASSYYRTAQYTYYLESFLTPIWSEKTIIAVEP